MPAASGGGGGGRLSRGGGGCVGGGVVGVRGGGRGGGAESVHTGLGAEDGEGVRGGGGGGFVDGAASHGLDDVAGHLGAGSAVAVFAGYGERVDLEPFGGVSSGGAGLGLVDAVAGHEFGGAGGGVLAFADGRVFVLGDGQGGADAVQGLGAVCVGIGGHRWYLLGGPGGRGRVNPPT